MPRPKALRGDRGGNGKLTYATTSPYKRKSKRGFQGESQRKGPKKKRLSFSKRGDSGKLGSIKSEGEGKGGVLSKEGGQDTIFLGTSVKGERAKTTDSGTKKRVEKNCRNCLKVAQGRKRRRGKQRQPLP